MSPAELKNRREQARERAAAGDLVWAANEVLALTVAQPDEAGLFFELGALRRALGDGKSAADALKRAVQLDPEDPGYRRLYAGVLEELGRLDEAVFQFLRAVRLAPADAGAHLDLGVAFYKRGRHQKAVNALLEAKRLAPEDPRVLFALGLAHDANRDSAAAIAFYRAALRIEPRMADAHRALGDALATVGEHEAAVEVYDELLRVERTNEDAALNREALSAALARLRRERLLGKTGQELERSALVREGRHHPATSDPGQLRFSSKLSQLLATLDEDQRIIAVALALTPSGMHPRRKDDRFGVTVLDDGGSLHQVGYATALHLTFLRECLGATMTQAAALYQQVLEDQGAVRFAGAFLFPTTMRAADGTELPGLEISLCAPPEAKQS